MLYLAALAGTCGETPTVLVDGYALGVRCPREQAVLTDGSVPLPDPRLLPTDETNA